jgi:hypothetical protein
MIKNNKFFQLIFLGVTNMSVSLSAADIQAINSMNIQGSRDTGVKVGQVCGVIGAVAGGLASAAQGGSVAGAITGAVAGGVVGYCAGTVFSPAEYFGTTGKILSGAAAASVGLGVSVNVATLVDCFIQPNASL